METQFELADRFGKERREESLFVPKGTDRKEVCLERF
jgi:hypothetical protein